MLSYIFIVILLSIILCFAITKNECDKYKRKLNEAYKTINRLRGDFMLQKDDVVTDGNAKFKVVKNATSDDIDKLQEQIDKLIEEIEQLKNE
jgi:sensor histidine kinase YesM